MQLTAEEVRYVALLARVGMTDDEVEVMRDQMSNILDQMVVLEQVDTDDVEPTGHSVDVRTVMREDVVEPCADRGDILSNAPNREGDFVRVRAVLE